MLNRDPMYAKGVSLLQGALTLDHSISIPELGTLFDWRGDRPLQKMKRTLATAYGMAGAFPSTNGTTILNILALLTATTPGMHVLVNRDAHVSVLAAMIHGDLVPHYVVPKYDRTLGVALGPTLESVRSTLDANPQVRCLFLTSPNYFGIVCDLEQIIAFAHERGVTVIVDAAHGPHLHFCDALPPGAEDLGADFVTMSTHKVANALSQGSLLLFRNLSDRERLYENVNNLGFVSTSFSFPILASIELGVHQLVERGQAIWRATIDLAEEFRARVRREPGVNCFGVEEVRARGMRDLDRSRVMLDISGTGLTGYAFEDRLIQLDVDPMYPEMATLTGVLFLVTPATSYEDAWRLLAAIRRIVASGEQRNSRSEMTTPPSLPPRAISPRQAHFARKRAVPPSEAVGRVSAETVATFPPGAAIIAAGEVVTDEVVEYLRVMRDNGAVLKGLVDSTFQTFRVVAG